MNAAPTLAALALALGPSLVAAQSRTLELDFAGLLSAGNRTDLAPITLSAGGMAAGGDYQLSSGGYYRLEIVSDGTQELAIEGPGFFRAVWVNEVVIEEIEVRPLGLASIEFDDAGSAEISFVAIVPGRYELRLARTSGESQRAVVTIE